MHRHAGVILGQAVADIFSDGGMQVDLACIDQLADRDGGEGLCAGCCPKAGIDAIGDLLGAVSKAVAVHVDDLAAATHHDHTGKGLLLLRDYLFNIHRSDPFFALPSCCGEAG